MRHEGRGGAKGCSSHLQGVGNIGGLGYLRKGMGSFAFPPLNKWREIACLTEVSVGSFVAVARDVVFTRSAYI